MREIIEQRFNCDGNITDRVREKLGYRDAPVSKTGETNSLYASIHPIIPRTSCPQ